MPLPASYGGPPATSEESDGSGSGLTGATPPVGRPSTATTPQSPAPAATVASWRTFHAIPEAAHRFDERCAQLAAQPRDEHLHGIRIAVEALRVDVLGQLALRDHAPG